MAIAIYPCSKCGGMGCDECATQLMDQIKAMKRRQDFKREREASYKETAIKILYWISGQSGQPFDPEDSRAENAIMLVMDVLRYQDDVGNEEKGKLISPFGEQQAMDVLPDRWAMLEFGEEKGKLISPFTIVDRLKTALELAEERTEPSWKGRKRDA